jgi:hypothetical protein
LSSRGAVDKPDATPENTQEASGTPIPETSKNKKKKAKFQKKQKDMQQKKYYVIERSPFLEDWISKVNSGEELDYQLIQDHVLECAIDQHGSRYIQKTLEETKDEKSA